MLLCFFFFLAVSPRLHFSLHVVAAVDCRDGVEALPHCTGDTNCTLSSSLQRHHRPAAPTMSELGASTSETYTQQSSTLISSKLAPSAAAVSGNPAATPTRSAPAAATATVTATAALAPDRREQRKAAEMVVADVRGTVEYRAAWDVELWKAIQTSRLRRELEEQKKKALAALAKFVKSREQQAMESCELRERESGRREQRLVEEEKQIEKRKWRLAEMEKDMRNIRQQLVEARRRAEAEAQAEVRRAKEDAAHAVALQEQRIQAAEAHTKRAEERLQQTQRDYLMLSEEFHRFRTRELAAPPEKSTSIEARLRTEFAMEQQALQDRLERRHAEREEQLTRRCRELEEENRRLTALATKRKEQMRRGTEEVARLTSVNNALEGRLRQRSARDIAAEAADARKTEKQVVMGDATPQIPAVDVLPIAEEIERLRCERRAILEGSAGALDVDSDVVRCLDAKINDMLERLNGRGPSL
ncbi:hypothetical protein TraAM80_05313 [Trypanosoma rangeli]|uniref:Trichohyalin n=1 Tax=Trypanosoma rangeli TaxID=5698 RepID=A0A422NFB5_TRYRA|nr:uncharacterized protein TraAM80_05313 [Trypanosoma rangeli]RNF04161.1 hypothetical protein TraAM80_05313 [Trypanosoma rangeli]|eukprot:RNF04161.1 hypothetical protein TraAM80_05313 [Trypanosoma rangeli]